MQRRDVGVSDEGLRVAAEDIGIEMRKQSHCAVAAGAGDNGLHIGVDPHAHETVRAAFVFGASETRQPLDLRVEQDVESGALERPHPALEPSQLWRVRRRDDADRVTFDDRPGAEQRNA